MDMGGCHQVDVVHAPQGEVLVQGDTAGGAVPVLFCFGAAAVDHHDKGTAGEGRVGTFQQGGLPIAHVDECQLQFFHRRSTHGPLDVEAGQDQHQQCHHDGAGAAEAEVQRLDTVCIQELSDGRGGARRATAGEDVHLLEQAEGVDGPQQGAQGQAALDVGQGDVPELLEEAGAVDAGGLILVLRHGLEGGVQQHKFSAVISTMPAAIIGGVSFMLYGMISAIGVRNVVENKVDLTKSRNLIIAGVIFVCGLGFSNGLTFTIAGTHITLTALAIAAIAGIVLNAVLPGNDYNFGVNPEGDQSRGVYVSNTDEK